MSLPPTASSKLDSAQSGGKPPHSIRLSASVRPHIWTAAALLPLSASAKPCFAAFESDSAQPPHPQPSPPLQPQYQVHVDHQAEWIYDFLGRLTQMKTKIGDFSYNYIGSTPLLQDLQVPNCNDVVFAWWTEPRRLAEAEMDDRREPAGRDEREARASQSQGRFLESITNRDPVNASQSYFHFDYDADGRMNKQTRNLYSSGGGVSAKYRTYDYTHDQVLQLTGATEKESGVLQANHSWTYDDAGNRTWKVESGVTTFATYNETNQVTATMGAEAFTFAYDANGNMLRKTGPVETDIAEIAYASNSFSR